MNGDINAMVAAICANIQGQTPEECAAYDAELERREAQQAEREKQTAYEKSGAPERYWRETIGTFQRRNAMQERAAGAVEKFLHAVRCGSFRTLILLGTAGTGKTHLVCGIIREIGGKYRTAPEIVEELRRLKSFTADETEDKAVKKYGAVQLLAIDEIGRGINATDEKYMLYQIINARYNTRRSTVLISNMNKADFLRYIGTASADRLVESAEVVEMDGDSYRRELRGING